MYENMSYVPCVFDSRHQRDLIVVLLDSGTRIRDKDSVNSKINDSIVGYPKSTEK